MGPKGDLELLVSLFQIHHQPFTVVVNLPANIVAKLIVVVVKLPNAVVKLSSVVANLVSS
jgi:hypothetical protein